MKKQNLLSSGILVLAILSMAFLQGCGSSATMTPAPHSQPAAPIVPTGAAPAPISEKVHINVGVEAIGEDGMDEILVSRIVEKVEGDLVRMGYSIDLGMPDIWVDLRVSSDLFDQSGNYYLFRGTVDGMIQLRHTSELLARNVFNTKGKRQLGEQQALLDLSSKVGMEVSSWVSSQTAPAKIGMVATNITVKRPYMADISSYASNFVHLANNLEGIVNCRVIAQDPASRSIVFRVVYFSKLFPEGLLNTLAGIDELDLDID